jgi:hypothetical protein
MFTGIRDGNRIGFNTDNREAGLLSSLRHESAIRPNVQKSLAASALSELANNVPNTASRARKFARDLAEVTGRRTRIGVIVESGDLAAIRQRIEPDESALIAFE